MNLIANNTTTLAYSKVGKETIVLTMIVVNYNVYFSLIVDGVTDASDESYGLIAKAYEAYIGEALAKG